MTNPPLSEKDHWSSLQTMTRKQFKKALDRLGWGQTEAARKLATNARTVRRYIAGDRKVPESVAKLIRLAEQGIDIEAV